MKTFITHIRKAYNQNNKRLRMPSKGGRTMSESIYYGRKMKYYSLRQKKIVLGCDTWIIINEYESEKAVMRAFNSIKHKEDYRIVEVTEKVIIEGVEAGE